MSYLYILATVLLTVYGQLVVKWQVSKAGALPGDPAEKAQFLLLLVLNPWVLSGFAAAFLAAVSWMAAMTKFELSYAYPFMSLTFPLVLVASALIFAEAITVYKIAGLTLIVAGIVVLARG
jgi:multidrug transporter EmrE-like cation transporter